MRTLNLFEMKLPIFAILISLAYVRSGYARCLEGDENTLSHSALKQSGQVILDLSDCRITDFEAAPFRHNAQLRDLNLSDNYIRKLKRSLVGNLTELETLWIENNALLAIERNFFEPLAGKLAVVFVGGNCLDVHGMRETFVGMTLKALRISNNGHAANCPTWRSAPQRDGLALDHLFGLSDVAALHLKNDSIARLAAGVFGGAASLEFLDLSFNRLERLPEGLFERNANLQWLMLNDNRLEALPWNAFFRNAKLTRVDASGNRLSHLEVSTFVTNAQLSELDLSDNALARPYGNSFHYSPRLKQLMLNRNGMVDVPEELFARNTLLEVLELSGNRIRTLPEHLLRSNGALETLRLSDNALRSIPRRFFDGAPRLAAIDLSGNRLKSVDGVAFPRAALAALALARNELVALGAETVRGLGELRSIDLERNAISACPLELLAALPRLDDLFLGRNHLQRLPDAVFLGGNESSSTRLHVTMNPLKCACLFGGGGGRKFDGWKVNLHGAATHGRRMPNADSIPVCVDDGDECDARPLSEELLSAYEEAIAGFCDLLDAPKPAKIY